MRRLALVLMLAATAAAAEAPDTSVRPQARGGDAAVAPAPVAAAAPAAAADSARAPPAAAPSNPETPPQRPWFDVNVSALAPGSSPRPQARAVPEPERVTGGEARAEWYNVEISRLAPARSLRPAERTPGVTARAARAVEERQRGAVCGDLALQGEAIGTVDGPGRCGVQNAVRLRAVDGVRLSSPATVNCRTATALKTWVERGLRPSIGNAGGGPAEMRVMASYSCRSRNNVSGARLSEHAFGNAIDIGGIRLADGSEFSVLRDWNRDRGGSALRSMHRAACGIFGTVLGPAANAAHRDHFHFDVASYRSGSYCR